MRPANCDWREHRREGSRRKTVGTTCTAWPQFSGYVAERARFAPPQGFPTWFSHKGGTTRRINQGSSLAHLLRYGELERPDALERSRRRWFLSSFQRCSSSRCCKARGHRRSPFLGQPHSPHRQDSRRWRHIMSPTALRILSDRSGMQSSIKPRAPRVQLCTAHCCKRKQAVLLYSSTYALPLSDHYLHAPRWMDSMTRIGVSVWTCVAVAKLSRANFSDQCARSTPSATSLWRALWQ